MKKKGLSRLNPLKDEQTTLALLAIILALAALWAIGCGGGGGSYSTPTPTTPMATPTAAANTWRYASRNDLRRA
jgi:fatty acid desaturase